MPHRRQIPAAAQTPMPMPSEWYGCLSPYKEGTNTWRSSVLRRSASSSADAPEVWSLQMFRSIPFRRHLPKSWPGHPPQRACILTAPAVLPAKDPAAEAQSLSQNVPATSLFADALQSPRFHRVCGTCPWSAVQMLFPYRKRLPLQWQSFFFLTYHFFFLLCVLRIVFFLPVGRSFAVFRPFWLLLFPVFFLPAFLPPMFLSSCPRRFLSVPW